MTVAEEIEPAHDRLAISVSLRREPPCIELNAIAETWFGSSSPVDVDRFRMLGGDVESPSGSLTLGRYLADRLLDPPESDGVELISAGSRLLIAVFADDTCTMFSVTEPDAASAGDRERRHALRNQINTINMNAELIDVLAMRSNDSRIRECAARIAEACRQAAATLDR